MNALDFFMPHIDYKFKYFFLFYLYFGYIFFYFHRYLFYIYTLPTIYIMFKKNINKNENIHVIANNLTNYLYIRMHDFKTKCLRIGFAYVGGACVVNKRLEKVNSVAIIEDTGGFSGIIVAAHEVGHL